MIGGLLTLINVIGTGYSVFKDIRDDIKKRGKREYKDFKKLPRSQQRQYMKAHMQERNLEELKAEIRSEVRRELEPQIRAEAWAQVGNVVSGKQSKITTTEYYKGKKV